MRKAVRRMQTTKAQIRKSQEEYQRGQSRDAAIFLGELRRKPTKPSKAQT
jgi:hypothetical protein